MRRLRGLLSVVALAGLCGQSLACLNDVDLPGREREFRSQYSLLPKAPEAERSRPEPAREGLSDGLLTAAGAALLLGAFALAARRDRETATTVPPTPKRAGEAFDLEERREPVEV